MVSTVIYIALKLVYFAKSDSDISLQISLLRQLKSDGDISLQK